MNVKGLQSNGSSEDEKQQDVEVKPNIETKSSNSKKSNFILSDRIEELTDFKTHSEDDASFQTDAFPFKPSGDMTLFKPDGNIFPLNTKLDVQTEGDKYACIDCAYQTRDKSNFVKHVNKHKGIRYPCDQCEYKATQSSNLNTHKKKYHP